MEITGKHIQRMLFYQVAGTVPQGSVLYNLPRLVEKMHTRGQRATLLAACQESAQHVDGILWTYTPLSFVPHGCAGRDDDPEEHPFWVTTTPRNENQSHSLLLWQPPCAQQCTRPHHDVPFQTLIYLFTEEDTGDLQHFYHRYPGVACSFWYQTTKGWKSAPPPLMPTP